MQKNLLCLIALGAFSITSAQAAVTLYGKIDESVLAGKIEHKDTTVQMKSGFASGSRFGLKGTEDLGNGYAVGFILEQGFNADTGAAGDSTLAFQRESALYLEGGFGRITAGRLGTLGFPQSTSILTGWVFGTTHGGSAITDKLHQHFSRVNNAVAFRTPTFSGLSLHAMYGNGTPEDTAQWGDNNHYYGIGLKYAAHGITASLFFEQVDNKNKYLKDGKTLNENRNAENHITFGAQYKIGMFTPALWYQYAWMKNNFKQNTFAIGVNAAVGGGTATLGTRYVMAKKDGEGLNGYVGNESSDKGNIWNIGAKYAYKLSKRTQVYGYAGYNTANKSWSKVTTNGEYFNGWQAAVGMIHDF